jgi:hypothetical protein
MAETVARRANPLAPLTDAEIRALPQPVAGRLVLRDPACRGLELRLAGPSSRNPGRLPHLVARGEGRRPAAAVHGRRYPEVGLAEARRRAGRLRAEALEGAIPSRRERQAPRSARLRRPAPPTLPPPRACSTPSSASPPGPAA